MATNAGPTARILVIDDDALTANVVRQASPYSQTVVEHVATAADARQALAEHPASLVILNLILPDADGRNLLSELRQSPEHAATPVFVLLGFLGPQPRDECLRLGATAVLEKPLDVDDLTGHLTSILAEADGAPRDPRHDPTTGLPNRVALAEAFSRVRTEFGESGAPFTIALLDLDRLADVNDTHGHEAGDAVLRSVSSRLAASLGPDDVLARWTDDEFVALLPRSTVQAAVRALTKAQAAIAATPVVDLGPTTIAMTISAGVVAVPAEISFDEALARAEGVLLRAKARGPSHVLSSEDRAEETPPTLLVAEDDRVAAALVRHRLERAGYEVLHRSNGQEALELAMEKSVALFVLDIRMPGMDGIELLKRLRESDRYADTPVLMLTSLGREEDIVRAFSLGASDYVTKPFSPVELLARVQRLLRRSGSTA